MFCQEEWWVVLLKSSKQGLLFNKLPCSEEGRQFSSSSRIERIESVLVPSRVYSCVTPSIHGFGTGSITALTSTVLLLKMDGWMNKFLPWFLKLCNPRTGYIASLLLILLTLYAIESCLCPKMACKTLVFTTALTGCQNPLAASFQADLLSLMGHEIWHPQLSHQFLWVWPSGQLYHSPLGSQCGISPLCQSPLRTPLLGLCTMQSWCVYLEKYIIFLSLVITSTKSWTLLSSKACLAHFVCIGLIQESAYCPITKFCEWVDWPYSLKWWWTCRACPLVPCSII